MLKSIRKQTIAEIPVLGSRHIQSMIAYCGQKMSFKKFSAQTALCVTHGSGAHYQPPRRKTTWAPQKTEL